MNSLSTTPYSITFTSNHQNITLIKNSIALEKDYRKEVLEVRGRDVNLFEQVFHLYGSVTYAGLEGVSGATDSNAPSGTSQNFQELVYFMEDFVYSEGVTDYIVASAIIKNTGAGTFVLDSGTAGSTLFDPDSLQIVDGVIQISLKEGVTFRKIAGVFSQLNKANYPGYYCESNYDTSFNLKIKSVNNAAVASLQLVDGEWTILSSTNGNVSVNFGTTEVLSFQHDSCFGEPVLQCSQAIAMHTGSSSNTITIFQLFDVDKGTISNGTFAYFSRQLEGPVNASVINNGLEISISMVLIP